MKKFLAKLCTVFLAIVCLFSVSACAPKLNIEKAAENLEDAGYTVTIADSELELTAAVKMMGLPSNAHISIEEALMASEDDNYVYILKVEKASVAKAYYKMIKNQFDAELQEIKDQIKLYEVFLKNYKKELNSTEIDYIEDAIKEMKKELEEAKEINIGRSGKWLWLGNKDGIKDSK
jgi:hypothetical protein